MIVILRTLCGCTKTMEIDELKRRIEVPVRTMEGIKHRSLVLEPMSPQFISESLFRVRTFVLHNQPLIDGSALYEEIPDA